MNTKGNKQIDYQKLVEEQFENFDLLSLRPIVTVRNEKYWVKLQVSIRFILDEQINRSIIDDLKILLEEIPIAIEYNLQYQVNRISPTYYELNIIHTYNLDLAERVVKQLKYYIKKYLSMKVYRDLMKEAAIDYLERIYQESYK